MTTLNPEKDDEEVLEEFLTKKRRAESKYGERLND